MEDWYSNVPLAPPDAIFSVVTAFKTDPTPDKVDLGIGAYRTEELKPWVLDTVRRVEQKLVSDPNRTKEYEQIEGYAPFRLAAAQLMFGVQDSSSDLLKRIATIQCLSGTVSLFVVGSFLAKYLPGPLRTVYVTDPTWSNHYQVFQLAGFPKILPMRYYDSKTKGLAMAEFVEDLTAAPDGSVIVLHLCAHNPTGVDPSREQWNVLLEVINKKNHVAIFDSAYQGFASGDLDADAYAVREAIRRGMLFCVTQSFAKNMGLYNDRVGAGHVVTANEEDATRVLSQLKIVARSAYSNPPGHGARIAAEILLNKELKDEWQQELITMSHRIRRMRTELFDALKILRTPGSWNHIVDQIGMFTYTGLTPAQVDYVTRKHHIYLLKSGRISMCGLNSANIQKVANAIHDAVTFISN